MPPTRSPATLRAAAILLLICPVAVNAGCQIPPNARGFVSIPNSTAMVKDFAFANCTALKNIHIPNSVKSIGKSSFAGSGLTAVVVPASVVSIGESAFGFAANLASVTFTILEPPDPTQSNLIGPSAFEGCVNLKSILLPDSLKNLGAAAFKGCQRLRWIFVPQPLAVNNVGKDALPACLGFGLKYADQPTVPSGNVTCVPCAGINHGQLKITENVQEIGEGAFAGCLEITAVAIPAKTSVIGRGAFRACANLSTVSIPAFAAVTTDAFAGCGCNVTLFKAGAQLCDCAVGPCSPLTPANKTKDTTIPKWEVSIIVAGATMPLVIVMVVSLIRGRPKPRATLFDGTHTAVVSRATRASVYEDMMEKRAQEPLLDGESPTTARRGRVQYE